MAKYNINYACGHGSTEKQLYGKISGRTEYVEWAERTLVCPDCYKAKMREQAKAETLTAEIMCNPFRPGVFFAVTKGDTYSIKDALKAAGCRWGEYHPSADILGMSRPQKAWMIQVLSQAEMALSVEEQTAKVVSVVEKLRGCGVQDFVMDNSPLAQIAYQVSGEMARKARGGDHA